MKKIFLLLSILLFCTNVLADKMTKDGFLSNKNGYAKDQKIKDPENKILLIYNHGQSSHDGPSRVRSGLQNNQRHLRDPQVRCCLCRIGRRARGRNGKNV